MLQQKRRHYLQNMLIRFIMHDYEVRVCVVDSARYGDPQSRKRIIVFVSQKTFALPELPPPTHGPGLIPFVTARDVIGDLEQILPRKEAGLIRVPKSDVFVNHHIESNQDEKKEQRLKADEPGHAILCGHAVGHYEFDRPCTNLECARLQVSRRVLVETPSQILVLFTWLTDFLSSFCRVFRTTTNFRDPRSKLRDKLGTLYPLDLLQL